MLPSFINLKTNLKFDLLFIALFLFTIFSEVLTAQSSRKEVTTQRTYNGVLTDSQKKLNAIQYEFEDTLKFFNKISNTNEAIVSTNNSVKLSNLFRYDFDNLSTKWELNVPLFDKRIGILDDKIYIINPVETSTFNIENGNAIWNAPFQIIDTLNNKNLALAFKVNGNYIPPKLRDKHYNKTILLGPKDLEDYLSFGEKVNFLFTSTKLFGIDLQTGKKVWERNILEQDEEFNYFEILNDSTLLAGGSGLHTLNFYDGKGWSYKLRTSKSAVKGKYPIHGIKFDPFYNNAVFTINEISSNILVDSAAYYLKGSKYVSKIDKKTGEAIWEKEVLPYLSSSASLIDYGENFILINTGSAARNIEIVKCGQVFVALVDKETGNFKYLHYLADYKNKVIDEVIIVDQKLIFLIGTDCVLFNPESGLIEKVLSLKNKKLKKYGIHSLPSSVFIYRNGQYDSVNSADYNFFNLVQKNIVHSISNDLSVKTQYPLEQIWYAKASDANFIFLSNNQNTVVLDLFFNIIAEQIDGIITELTDKHFYTQSGKTLYEFSLEDLKN